MAQDTTPAIVIYQGNGSNKTFSIPFDKGEYGSIKVAFVRRGHTDYHYNPTTYTVDGYLYAWDLGGSPKQYYYTKTNDDKVYDANNAIISGVTLNSMASSSAMFSDGKTGYRAYANDISFHSLLEWLGDTLTVDDWICIVRETQTSQPYTYPNNQKHIEGALDNLSRQVQELKAQSDISLKVDATFVQDSQKMNPIDWLNTIVRSTDGTARGFRYRDNWLEYSTDNPELPEDKKSWTRLLNTTNITTVREYYDEENNARIPQYSKDGGLTWVAFGSGSQQALDDFKQRVYTKSEIDNKVVAINAEIDANAEAIQKTRNDYEAADQRIRADMNAKDSELEHMITEHADELTTLRGNQASLGDQVSGIEEKIPESASGSNPLVTKRQLLDEEMDIREDLNKIQNELQTQLNAQATAIAGKQDQLTAGDNVVIDSNGVISATVPDVGGFDMVVVDQLPETGEKGILYLVKKDGAAPDVHDEYVWIDATQTFELIGTTQVDLTDYVKFTDYAGVGGKAGVIRPQATYGVTVSPSSGVMYSNSLTLTEYQAVSTACFMSKGTLENIKDDIVKRGITTNTITLTDDEKASARQWQGATRVIIRKWS